MNYELKKAMTMVEILIVVAVIAMLVGGMFFVSGKASESAKEQLVASTLATLDTALQQYYDECRAYPPDVNYATGSPAYTRSIQDAMVASGLPFVNPVTAGYSADPEAESIEVLYYYLNRVPQSRQVLSKLPESAVSGKAVKFVSGYPQASRVSDPGVYIRINGTDVSLIRVVDVWNMPLQYIRYRDPTNLNVENTNFPLLRSAGPDKKYGTADDITNKKN